MKILITSGCSFSSIRCNDIDTWPIHLHQQLQPLGYVDHVSSAMSSQGNGLISRGVIYTVSQALKQYAASDILVGVMWSGFDRWDYRVDDPRTLTFIDEKFWIENPRSVVDGVEPKWAILNHPATGYSNKETELYYKYFYSTLGAYLQTLEHMLRVQWFLKRNNIGYFYTCYTDETLFATQGDIALNQHPEARHLYELLDFDNFLPGTSEFAWVEQHYGHPKNRNGWEGFHPGTEQHRAYTEQVIVPWLQQRKYI